MNPVLVKYKVTPSVVEADKESVITIKSVDGIMRFWDDVTYDVTVIPQDESDVPLDEEMSLRGYNKNRKHLSVKAQNGELKISYFFKGEQEWRIHISTTEGKENLNPLYTPYDVYWHYLQIPEKGIDVRVYSLKEDLYGRRALRGDLHLHTVKSDGTESPELVAACYRKIGRDFIAVTDHNVFHGSAEAEEKLHFVKNFQILRGEEVHNGYAGFFHMVNIGGDYSVNEIYLKDPERVKRETEAIAQEIEVPDGLDQWEYCSRVWLYRTIKKSGGFAIYPHPYWTIGYFHTSTAMSKAILRNGLCDAFEVIGGCKGKGNNLQLALYQALVAEGCRIPVVGSTDSHTVLAEEHLVRSTVVFAEGEDILKAVQEGYSVAVESEKGTYEKVYGDLRLVTYTHFLLENYYPVHTELCAVSGTLLEGYVAGKTELREMILQAERLVSEFDEEFFGKGRSV